MSAKHKAESPYRIGPLYLYRRGPVFHIRGTYDDEVIRVSTKTDDLRRAKLALDELLHELESGWRASSLNDDDATWRRIAKAMCARHRVHSRARGVPFQIEAHDVYRLMKEAGFRCAVSGIPLSRRIAPSSSPDPWGASIDRIEGRHGYIKDNVRVVCLAANLAMNRWGFDVLLRLANAVARNAGSPLHEQRLTQNPSQPNLISAQVIDFERISA